MGTEGHSWRIDRGLAGDLSAALGWDPAEGVAALAVLIPTSVPMGSTAKLAAIAAGEVPPGADPEPLARRLLEHCRDRSAGTAGGAPSPSWSCWVASTVMAGLVEAAGLGPVHVAATRRSDAGAPIVDFHAAVVVVDDGADWICDPYFGVAVALPSEPGAEAVAVGATGVTTARRTVDGAWHYDLGLDIWVDLVLRFQRLGPSLDAADVHAMAAISVTHSGVPLRPYARLHVGGGIADASESEDGTARLATWAPGTSRVEETVPTWAEAVRVFAERSGTRIV